MQYKLLITKIENKKVLNVSISTMSEPFAVLRKLAECFREVNKATRKNDRITRARTWETFAPDGLKCQKFSFEIKYDELNHYNYEFEFKGCGLD